MKQREKENHPLCGCSKHIDSTKLKEGRKNGMVAVRDLEQTKERLLSFAGYAKDEQPEILDTLIQTIVERIFIPKLH